MPILRRRCHQASPRPLHGRGFTLIELMVVAVIIGILAAIAVPAYQKHVMKGRRSDAISAISTLTQAEERWRSRNASYTQNVGDLIASADCPAAQAKCNSPGGHYELSIVAPSVDDITSGYQIHAKPLTTSPQANDSDCQDMSAQMTSGTLVYTDTNPNTTRASSVCWPQ